MWRARFIVWKQLCNTRSLASAGVDELRARDITVRDVTLVRWPAEADRRDRLAGEEAPRLLLVENGAAPPPAADCLEDWIRVPAPACDLDARVAMLSARASRHEEAAPLVDEHGVVRFGGVSVPLPPVEARLTAALLNRCGAVVSREALGRAGWPEGAPGRNALDVHVLRLRRRLVGAGLVIRTVRSRGYLLEVVRQRSQHSSR